VGVDSTAAPRRSGIATAHQAGEKWSVEVLLEEDDRQYTVFLNRTFVTEALASSAGEQVVAEWEAGRVRVRDLMLQELAASYRRLRTLHKTMQPTTVPATRAAWDHAIGAWEGLGWIGTTDAARYRDHVLHAFDGETNPVRRHKLQPDPDAAL